MCDIVRISPLEPFSLLNGDFILINSGSTDKKKRANCHIISFSNIYFARHVNIDLIEFFFLSSFVIEVLLIIFHHASIVLNEN